jgi:hypothetical protein
MSRTEVQHFFERYQHAFNRCDGDAVADLWHSSSGIAHPVNGKPYAALTWWPIDTPMRANMHALCTLYRAQDFDHADFEIITCMPMGNDHAFAVLHWTLVRKDQSCLQSFHTAYNLMRGEAGPKVILATQFEEDIAAMKSYATH